MPAGNGPGSLEDICSRFQRAMAAGDLDRALSVYDQRVVFLTETGETVSGLDQLRQQLAPLAAAKAHFEYKILQFVEADGIAVMHTEWTVSHPRPMKVHAIEVARRQPDGTWRWLIGDPFTVGKHRGAIDESIG